MKPKKDNGTTRREFIEQMSLLGMASMLPLSFFSCGKDTPDAYYQGTGLSPFKEWEEMLMALQSCPDNLEGRMKALIASKDAEAMFDFVTNEIYLMPASNVGIGSIGTQFKWGIKGVLRYGMATPREKAELLNHMYSEAGIPSKVVYERTNINPEEAKAFFLRPIQRKLTLEVSKNQWKQWAKALQTNTDTDYKTPLFDPDFSKTNSLAETLWSFMPDNENLKTHKFDFRWDNYRTPTVEFQINDTTKYAHLFDTAVPFGTLKNNGRISNADTIKLNEETVEIILSYREAIYPDIETELISGSWKSTDLIGNQIHFACLNGLSLEQSAITPIGNLRIFTPTLAFQDFNAPLEKMQEHSFISDPFTLEGEKLIFPENNEKNTPIVLNVSSKQLLKKVDKVTLKAQPINDRLVKLEVEPVDSEGKIIEGLQARDFKFSDNKRPVQVLMESNRRTPKVLILYDASLSMPKDYYGEQMDTFVVSVQEKILSNFPAAIIEKWKTPSELFTWLLKASKTNYDLIVYATDGDTSDAYNEQHLEAYQNGPPALILNVYNSEAVHTKKTFDKMSEVTNGFVLNAKDQKVVIEKVVEFINAMNIPPYTFSYHASSEVQHEVVLTLDNERLKETANFELHANPNFKDLNQGIIGIYLSLKVGNKLTKRVLAGWDPITQPKQKPTKSHYSDVKGLILGGTTFYFEGEGPTLAASLADLLKYKLSTRPWGEALLEDDLAAAKTEFEKGGFQFHPDIMTLMAPIENGVTNNTFTFASGIRIGVYKQKVNIEDKKATQSFDFLPTSSYVSFTNENALKINLQKTAQLAIREASLFTQSTFAELVDKTLIERTNAVATNWFTREDRKILDTYYWIERVQRGDGNYKIFDVSGLSKAFWQISAQGELYGILEDETGGGSSEEILQRLADIMAVLTVVIALLQEMKALNPIGGVALSIVATYGVTLTKLYAVVCETLVIMDASGMDEKIKMAMKELAFNIAKTIYSARLGSDGNIMSGLDVLLGLIGVKTNPFS
jgi:hypothetical protein